MGWALTWYATTVFMHPVRASVPLLAFLFLFVAFFTSNVRCSASWRASCAHASLREMSISSLSVLVADALRRARMLLVTCWLV